MNFDDEFGDDFDEEALASIDQASSQRAGSSVPALKPAPPNVPTPPSSVVGKQESTVGSSLGMLPALKQTLSSTFGHAAFREGQAAVVEAAVRGRDAAVFWATGKSTPTARPNTQIRPLRPPYWLGLEVPANRCATSCRLSTFARP